MPRATDSFRQDITVSPGSGKEPWAGTAIVVGTLLQHLQYVEEKDFAKLLDDANTMARELLAEFFPRAAIPPATGLVDDTGPMRALADVLESHKFPALATHFRICVLWICGRHRTPAADGTMDISPDELELVVKVLGHSERQNNTPRAELNGLTPAQAAALIDGDWRVTGPLRVDARLPLRDLSGARFFQDARTILALLRDEGPLAATATGALSRASVAALLPRLSMDHSHLDSGLFKVVNELDAVWLSVCRVVLETSRLIACRKRQFAITKRGRGLLDDAAAGELYALLFLTLFREMDLGQLGSRPDEERGLNETIACSFYLLDRHARRWTARETLAEKAWLEGIADPPHTAVPNGPLLPQRDPYIFAARVLDPLAEFGLLSRRALGEDRWTRTHEYRVTPLFRRFLRFDFRPAFDAGNPLDLGQPPSHRQ